MSGGATTSSTKVSYPKWLKKDIMYGIGQAKSLYANPATPPSLYVGMDPSRYEFLTGAAQTDVTNPSTSEYGKTLRGEYLNNNPYLDQVISRSLNDVQGQVGSQFGGSGRFGGGQWASSLADATLGTSAALRNANYQAERDRMGSYLGMEPTVLAAGEYPGSVLEEDRALKQEEAYRQFQWPYEKLNQLLGSIYGSPMAQRPGTATSSSKEINWLDIVGGLFGGGGGMMCWVADELFGVDSPKTHAARRWCRLNPGHWFVRVYGKHGRSWAAWLRTHPWAKPLARPIWELLAVLGREEAHAATCHP